MCRPTFDVPEVQRTALAVATELAHNHDPAVVVWLIEPLPDESTLVLVELARGFLAAHHQYGPGYLPWAGLALASTGGD